MQPRAQYRVVCRDELPRKVVRQVKENVGEKLTDEDAENMIEETDVDNAQ